MCFLFLQATNIRKLQVGPVKPVAHKHSAIVEAVCRQVPPFKHVFIEQTEPINIFLIFIQYKNNIFFLLHSHRAPAKSLGQIH